MKPPPSSARSRVRASSYQKTARRQSSLAWNQRAGRYKPEDPSYLWNLSYFASRS